MVKGLGNGSYPQNLWITEQDERSASRAMILGLASLLDMLNPALARTIIPIGEPNALLSKAERGRHFLLEGGVPAENGP